MTKTFLEEHRKEIFKKYDTEVLIRDVTRFKNGQGMLSKTLCHFFKERIYECYNVRGRMSPIEAMQNDEVMKTIIDYINTKPKFYDSDLVTNVESFFRNGGKIATKVGNFDPRNARRLYERYNPHKQSLNILDTSAGFGARMLTALLTGNSYYGIDPNQKLNQNLNECLSFLRDNDVITDSQKCKLFCQGSETFIPELVNTCDIMFTSPPYFNLETYSKDTCASTKNYNDYNGWLSEFVEPTIDNIIKYMKVGGVIMINIKNLTHHKRNPLFDDWKRIMESKDSLKYVETLEINHQAKKYYTKSCNYNVDQYKGFKEPVMVFRKVK